MSIGSRLKEERTRLKFSQTDFAALAGASKGAQLKWEKDESSPTAQILEAFAKAGADVFYIVTGRKASYRPDNAVTQIEDDLADIERDLLEPNRWRRPGDDDEQSDERMLTPTINRLEVMLNLDAPFLTREMSDRASALLDIARDPMKLSLFRAADYAQMRKRREQMKEHLAGWLEGGPYEPGEAVMNHLARLALDYAVPFKWLIEIVYEIHTDIIGRLPDQIEGLRS